MQSVHKNSESEFNTGGQAKGIYYIELMAEGKKKKREETDFNQCYKCIKKASITAGFSQI
jgi:hypothetical protein